jgi:hypothetical protein
VCSEESAVGFVRKGEEFLRCGSFVDVGPAYGPVLYQESLPVYVFRSDARGGEREKSKGGPEGEPSGARFVRRAGCDFKALESNIRKFPCLRARAWSTIFQLGH